MGKAFECDKCQRLIKGVEKPLKVEVEIDGKKYYIWVEIREWVSGGWLTRELCLDCRRELTKELIN